MQSVFEKLKHFFIVYFSKSHNIKFNKIRLRNDELINEFIELNFEYLKTKLFKAEIRNYLLKAGYCPKFNELFMEYFFSEEKVPISMLAEKYELEPIQIHGIILAQISHLRRENCFIFNLFRTFILVS